MTLGPARREKEVAVPALPIGGHCCSGGPHQHHHKRGSNGAHAPPHTPFAAHIREGGGGGVGCELIVTFHTPKIVTTVAKHAI